MGTRTHYAEFYTSRMYGWYCVFSEVSTSERYHVVLGRGRNMTMALSNAQHKMDRIVKDTQA